MIKIVKNQEMIFELLYNHMYTFNLLEYSMPAKDNIALAEYTDPDRNTRFILINNMVDLDLVILNRKYNTIYNSLYHSEIEYREKTVLLNRIYKSLGFMGDMDVITLMSFIMTLNPFISNPVNVVSQFWYIIIKSIAPNSLKMKVNKKQ